MIAGDRDLQGRLRGLDPKLLRAGSRIPRMRSLERPASASEILVEAPTRYALGRGWYGMGNPSSSANAAQLASRLLPRPRTSSPSRPPARTRPPDSDRPGRRPRHDAGRRLYSQPGEFRDRLRRVLSPACSASQPVTPAPNVFATFRPSSRQFADLRNIGAAGFEPATPCSQSRCATKLRHAPMTTKSRRRC